MSKRWAFWRSASFWLSMMAIAVFVRHVTSPRFQSVVAPDTAGYVWRFDRVPIGVLLETKRTFGYPVFLEAVRLLGGDHSRVAEAQLAVFLAAAVGFGAAVRVFSGSRLTALAAAAPLLFARMIPMQAVRIMSDLLASAAAVATLGLLLLVVARPASKLAWAGLGLALFYTYQVRPACLFLVVLVPLLGLALPLLRRGLGPGPQGGGGRAALRLGAGLCLLAFAPFLLWCSLRWALVGHFGLVSFGGANIIGITASMVSPEIVPRLPEEHRPFARALIKERERQGLAPLAPDYDYRRWVYEYNTNAHKVAPKALKQAAEAQQRAARQAGDSGPGTAALEAPARWVETNRYYTRFSVAVIRARPDLYRRWLAEGCRYTWDLLAHDLVTRRSAIALTVAFGLWLLTRLVWRGRKQASAADGESPGSQAPGSPSPGPPAPGPRPARVSPATQLLVVAVAFFLASQVLVTVVEVPQDRYTFLSGILLPGAFAALAVELLRSAVLRGRARFRHTAVVTF